MHFLPRRLPRRRLGFLVPSLMTAALMLVTSSACGESNVAAQTKSPVARSKANDMLPSRVHKGVKLTEAATLRLPIITRDAIRGGSGKGQPLQIGVVRTVSLDPSAHGEWYDLGDSGGALVLGIISEGAAQVRVQFADTDLPPGAKLFVRSMIDSDEVYGAFEGRGALGDGTFWSPPVRGGGVVIEYFDPRPSGDESSQRQNKSAPFRVNQISHIFRR